MPPLAILQKRSDFLLAAQSGFKYVKPSIVIQARRREIPDDFIFPIRVGFTATKRIGNAVIRNRAKRRMRAAVRNLVMELGIGGCDYVFIARDTLTKTPFKAMIKEIRHSLKKLAELLEAAKPVAKIVD